MYGVLPWHIDGGPPILTYAEIDVFLSKMDESLLFLKLRSETGRG